MNDQTFKMYGGDVELKYYDAKHQYFVDGFYIDGVTSILGVVDKPMLVPWAAKEAVRHIGYYDKEIWTPDGYVSVPEEEQASGHRRMVAELERMKTLNPDEYWRLLKEAKGEHMRKKEEAADIGTMVHAWIESYIKYTLGREIAPPNPPTLPKVKEGVAAFLEWVAANKIEFTLSEEKIYSRKHKYAGTLDFACRLNEKLTMGDIKTSNFYDPKMFWQVSAYQAARQEEFVSEKYEEQVIVRCGKDGTLEVHKSKGFKKDIKAFYACQVIYNRLKEIKTKNS